MSDDKFAENLHLTKGNGDDGGQSKKTVAGKKEGKAENDSEDDLEELGPSLPQELATRRQEQNMPKPTAARREKPTTPLTRAQAAIRRAAVQERQKQMPIPSPPLTRAQSAKKQACEGLPQPTPRAARLDPGLESQPRVILSPIDKDTLTRTPVPPDMANYYRNYKSPGRGKPWGPTNEHPPQSPSRQIPRIPCKL